MTWLNIGCGPFKAPKPWVNTDVISIPGNVEPDILVKTPWPSELVEHGIPKGSLERVYLGHVMEHIRWDRIHDFMDQLKQMCAPGAEVMIVGPDSNRTIQLWKEGIDTWEDVIGILEDDVHYQTTRADWEGARHCWNCYEGRIVRLLQDAGFDAVEAVPINPDALEGWPVVAFTQHQCAAKGRVPKKS